MTMAEVRTDALAQRILGAAAAVASIPPLTGEDPDFGLQEAYRVAAAVIRRRIARGEKPVGWKIGFTNRTIWDEYGVYAPIWGPIYDTTLERVDPAAGPASCSLASLLEPRLEPEIALRLAAVPRPDMDEAALLACVDAVAHGFELVQSLFPDWRFRAADTVAAFALHGLYRCGPMVPVEAADRNRWFTMLETFQIALFRDGVHMDTGAAANVLGGPLFALRHLVRGLAETPLPAELKAGDIVTTGTITRAFPVGPGESWTTEVAGLPVPGLSLTFT